MARPTKLTPVLRDAICEAIAHGCYAELAARAAGIGERTFYRWMELGAQAEDGTASAPDHRVYQQFRQAVEVTNARTEVAAVTRLRELAMAATPQRLGALIEFLQRRFPERWSLAPRREKTGPTPITVSIVTTAPPDEATTG